MLETHVNALSDGRVWSSTLLCRNLAFSDTGSIPLRGIGSVWSCDADSWTCTTACSAELLHTTSLSAQASPARGGTTMYNML